MRKRLYAYQAKQKGDGKKQSHGQEYRQLVMEHVLNLQFVLCFGVCVFVNGEGRSNPISTAVASTACFGEM
jgi:hypothetical protein